MWEIWTNKLLLKALKSCPKSNKSPNLVTLNVIDTDHWLPKVTSNLPQPCFRSVRVVTSGLIYPKGKNGLFWLFSPFTLSLSLSLSLSLFHRRQMLSSKLEAIIFIGEFFSLCSLSSATGNQSPISLSVQNVHPYLPIYLHTHLPCLHTHLPIYHTYIHTYSPTHTRSLLST